VNWDYWPTFVVIVLALVALAIWARRFRQPRE
jgi:hypothetical protein